MSNIKTYHINRYLYSYCAFETKNFPIKARTLTVVPFEYIIKHIIMWRQLLCHGLLPDIPSALRGDSPKQSGRNQSCQSTGVIPFLTRKSFAFEKCLHPKKPYEAESGLGCAAVSTRCLSDVISGILLFA